MALTTNLPTQRNIFETKKFNIEMWLNLVERCVRDAKAVGSNPVISTKKQLKILYFQLLLLYLKSTSNHYNTKLFWLCQGLLIIYICVTIISTNLNLTKEVAL